MFLENFWQQAAAMRSSSAVSVKILGYVCTVFCAVCETLLRLGLIGVFLATHPLGVQFFFKGRGLSSLSSGIWLMSMAIGLLWIVSVAYIYAEANRKDPHIEGGITMGVMLWLALLVMWEATATYVTGMPWQTTVVVEGVETVKVQSLSIHILAYLGTLAAAWYLTARLIALRPFLPENASATEKSEVE
jgi:hypothetical protein